MNPLITIVVACFNDQDELAATIASIVATAAPDGRYELVIVDDASKVPVTSGFGRVIRNQQRIGVGPSRHIGALAAKGDMLLFVDSHSRFTNGWLEAILERLPASESTVYCGVCLGLGMTNQGKLNMDVVRPNATYHGATWNFLGPDKKFPRILQVFESIWAEEQPGDHYELSAVMGAAYCVPKAWYLKLHCGQHLCSYGVDEQELSLKTWLCGGTIRMMKKLRIGHKFKQEKKPSAMGGVPYNATKYVLRNKLFVMHTCLPPKLATLLAEKLPRGADLTMAKRELEAEWRHVEIERFYNAGIFTRDLSWFQSKFGLSCPAY